MKQAKNWHWIIVSGVCAGAVMLACGGGGPTRPVNVTVTTVDVTASIDTLTAFGETTALTAVARDQQGNVVSDATFTWASSDDLLATVDGNGVVTAVANGDVTITASAT